MIKNKLYFYVGTNGTLMTPIHIKGAESSIYYRLEAGDGKVLTKDDEIFVDMVTVPEEELGDWKEVKAK